jgi:hypothetical protein
MTVALDNCALLLRKTSREAERYSSLRGEMPFAPDLRFPRYAECLVFSTQGYRRNPFGFSDWRYAVGKEYAGTQQNEGNKSWDEQEASNPYRHCRK